MIARHSQAGIALVVALSLLLVITIMGITTLESGLLEIKMSQYDREKILSLQEAERVLAQKEIAINHGVLPSDAIVIAQGCGVSYYRITATSKVGIAGSAVQSTYAVARPAKQCAHAVQVGRQSWREKNLS